MRPKRNPFDLAYGEEDLDGFTPAPPEDLGFTPAPPDMLPPQPVDPGDGAGGYGPGPRYRSPEERYAAEGEGTYGEGGNAPPGPRVTSPEQIGTLPPAVQSQIASERESAAEEVDLQPRTDVPRPRPRVGHLGGLPPIAPQYSRWESVDELNAAYDDAKAELRERAFFSGELTLDDYRAADEKLEKERAQAIAQQQAFEGSVPGKELQLARHQLATAHEQQEFQAQELGREAWAAQMRALQTKDARRQLDESAEEARQRRMRIEARIEGEMISYKNALRDLENSTIDPYGRRTTGDKIAAAIAIGLTGLGAGLQGGGPSNMGMVMASIQGQIDRDVQAQIAALEARKAGLAGRTTLVGMLRERLGDTDRAEAAAKAHIYSQLELRVKTAEETAKSQILQLRAKALRTELGRRKEEFEQAAALQAQIKAEGLERQRAAAIAYAARQQQLAEERAALASQGVIDVWTEGDFPKGGQYVEGIGIVGSGDLASETIRKIQGSKEVERLANEIKRGGKVGWENLQRKEQLMAAMALALKNAENMGALDAGALEVSQKITGNPNVPWGEVEAKATQLIVQTQRKRQDMINSLGPIPAQRVLVEDEENPGRRKVRYYVTGTPQRYNVNPVTTQ